MAAQKPPPPPPTTKDQSGATTISAVPADILEAHILNRLNGETLASAACASRQLHHLSSQPHLWAHLCHSTWPSTTTSPRLLRLISTFPGGGPHSFFSSCFPPPLLLPSSPSPPPQPLPELLISAVDLRLGGALLFSRAQETDAASPWFRCSPFRVDMLEPKESVPALAAYDGACDALAAELTLSWIMADPESGAAVDVSSGRAVAVRRHWLTGDVEVRFAAVLAGDGRRKGAAAEYVEFAAVVTCGRAEEGGGMHVREVSLRVEDMEGTQLTGREGMVILRRALLEGKRGKRREEEAKRRHEEFFERKREWKERRAMAEKRLDRICLAVGGSFLAVFSMLFLCW